jgi:hypothetical protein
MLGNYFYNATVKRVVSVFGTLFNNIKIAKTNSSNNTIHVPIAYGPRQKFLARIREEANFSDPGVAIKMPRLSFEMTSIDYDSSVKLNKLNKLTSGPDLQSRTTSFQSVPYTIGMQLNVYAKNQDDALQIVEQILPTFNPEYTVTIKGIDGPNSKTDVPFILNGVSFQDDYEGDFGNNRRTIIYTLDFTIKAKFAPGAGTSKIIKRVQTKLADFNVVGNTGTGQDSPASSIFSQINISADSPGDLDSPQSIRTFISFINPNDTYKLEFNSPAPSFTTGEMIIGQTSLVAANVQSFDSPKLVRANRLEGLFTVGETIIVQDSPARNGVLASITRA